MTTTFVTIVGLVFAIIALLVLGRTIIRALRDKAERQAHWRGVKVLSACCGMLSLFLFFLSFESQIREQNLKSKQYAFEEFLELKFYTTNLKSIACSKDLSSRDAANECFDFRNIDNQISFVLLRESRTIESINNWQNNPHLDEPIAFINRRLETINAAFPLAAERPLLNFENRIRISIAAFLILIVGLSGSLGEAIFQYRMAKATVIDKMPA